MATIGELIININASTAAFVTEIEKVKEISFNTAAEIQRSFAAIGTAALGMIGVAAGAMAEGVAKTIEFQTHILHLSEAAGASVESISGLAFAAKMYGLNIDDVAKAMERFDKQLIAAGAGNAKSQQNMSLLGIDPAQIKTSDDALMKLADHFAAMPDGVLKTGEAMLAFGKAGAMMIPMLNEGSEGLQKMLDLARGMGLTFSKDDAEAAHLFEQNVTILKGSFEGFRMELEKALLPNLNQLVDAMVNTRKEMGNNQTAIDVLKFSAQAIGGSIVLVIGIMNQFGTTVKFVAAEARLYFEGIALGAKAMWAGLTGDGAGYKNFMIQANQAFEGASQADNDWAREAEQNATQFQRLTMAIWDPINKKIEDHTKAFSDASAAAAAHQKAVEKLKTSVENLNSTLATQIATVGMSAEQAKEYEIRAEAVKLGIQGWAEKELELYRQLSTKKSVLDDIAKIEDQTKAENKLLLHEAWVKSLQQELQIAQAILDVEMKPPPPPTLEGIFGQAGPNPAFTQAVDELTSSLQHQIATWGLTTSQVTLYNLSLIDSKAVMAGAADGAVTLVEHLQHIQDVTKAWQEFSQVAGRALDELIVQGKSLGDVMKSLIQSLAEMILKWSLFGMNGQGGLFGSIFSGLKGLFGFAGGGGVSAGNPIIVGENGPEIFTPSVTGAIIPNGAIGGAGGGAQVNYYIDARGSSITEEQFRRSLAESESRAVKRSLNATRELQLRTA